MTQRLAKIFGFEVKIDDVLTPAQETVLQTVASDLARVHQIDTKKFFVYFHHLVLVPVELHDTVPDRVVRRVRPSKRLREGDLSEKIKWLWLGFDVNKKQTEQGSIKFFNSLVGGDNLPEHAGKNIKPSYSDYEVSFLVPGSFFKNQHYFRSTIITFIDTERVHLRHRKIKATVLVGPTKEYAERIQKIENRMPNTKIDVRFQKYIQLRLPLDSDDQAHDDIGSNTAPIESEAQSLVLRLPRLIKVLSEEKSPNPTDLEILREVMNCEEESGLVPLLQELSLAAADRAERIGLRDISELIRAGNKQKESPPDI